MIRPSALIAIAAIALTAGYASTGSTTAAGAPSAAPSSAPSSEPSAVASSGPCVTHACIVQDLDKGLVGAIDQADAVATKIRCKASTVKNEGHGNYDARCTVHYSDHTYATGYGTVDMSQGKVLFSPGD